MKNTFKTLGIIVVIAVMVFSMASCAFMTEFMTGAVQQMANPVVGTWSGVPAGGTTTMIYTFTDDGKGTLVTVNNNERSNPGNLTWTYNSSTSEISFGGTSMKAKYNSKDDTFLMSGTIYTRTAYGY